ncbi:MAG TPA: ribose-phosphate diphosphokinase [Steroidobacteraceae bacterium]
MQIWLMDMACPPSGFQDILVSAGRAAPSVQVRSLTDQMDTTFPAGPLLLAPPATQRLGGAVAAALGTALSTVELRPFGRGDFKIRPLGPVRGRDVYLLHGLYGDPQGSACDRLCELLFLAGAVGDAGAARVSALIPYLAFARKDRRTKARDPVTSRYVAQMIESVGIGHVMAVEVHNPAAFDNAFRIPADHLTTTRLFADHFAARFRTRRLAVVSPDLGGAKRAQLLREALQRRCDTPVEFGCVEKRRSAGVVSGHYFAGDVSGCSVILLDDLISSGETLLRAAQACRAAGATEVHAAAAHAPLAPAAAGRLNEPTLDSLTVTDTVPLDSQAAGQLGNRVTVLPIAGLLADAIACQRGDGSLSTLLELDG